MATDRVARRALDLHHVTVSYGPRPALLDVSVSIEPGQLIGIIGPNGAGKSTLVKAILGFVEPDFGTVQVFGEQLSRAPRRIAYVPQRGAVDWDFPVRVIDVAAMGCYGRVPWWRRLGPSEHREAEEALNAVGMLPYRDRQIGELSGGQQQRVFLARALAQGSEILLLDEPLAGVDAATERTIMRVLRNARDQGRTLLVVHHDLATAAEYFDRLLLLKQRVLAFGPPATVLQEDLLNEVYEGRLRSFTHAITGEHEAVSE
ncbi:MAG: metal ABC transporter ATP-binding protein [Planctomycetota bacterium]|nr:metal ABC transporter ATP-binding protein [Planctomycetota bacterium]